MATCMEQLDWMRTLWCQMTTAEFSLDSYAGAKKKQPALLATDCTSLYDATRKEGAAPSSTDKRHATELPTVKSRAMEGEADSTWIDARYQIADCLTKHASRKAEEALQQVINKAQWWTTEEETMLESRRTKRERGQESFVRQQLKALKQLYFWEENEYSSSYCDPLALRVTHNDVTDDRHLRTPVPSM